MNRPLPIKVSWGLVVLFNLPTALMLIVVVGGDKMSEIFLSD